MYLIQIHPYKTAKKQDMILGHFGGFPPPRVEEFCPRWRLIEVPKTQGAQVFHVNSLGIDTMLDELQRCVAPQRPEVDQDEPNADVAPIAFGFSQPQVPVDLRLDVAFF